MNEQIMRLSAALADRYRIERELGQGGMATVYLAEDLKHKRLVAVKVLKPELAAVLGGERFVVEITTTASMSHPHILPLFDSGAADGFLFYVMPYIEGETLRDKLNRETQLGIDDSVRIAREVLDALEYAHSRGVIHRDIKPENILMQGGRPMIADFGIALAVSAAAGGRMTETGLSLGTPHYMSPEQATAEKEITGRADIYSLASVLYEMLTGEPPHTGSSAQQIIMKIITEPAAAVTKFRKSVPAHVAAAVAKALEKLPADRFTTAHEFSEALGNPAFTVTGAADLAGTRPVTGRARALHWAIGASVGALATAAAFTLLRSPAPAPDVVRFEMSFSPGVQLDIQIDEDAPFAISPDGRHVVFATRDSLKALGPLHIREIGQLGSRAIPGTETGVAPFFSPDGQWIGYATDDDQLRKVSISGGPSITLARDVQPQFAGGNWSDDGFIWYTSSNFRAARIRATGGESEVMDSGGTGGLFWPHVLPGSGAVLYTECNAACQSTDLILFDVATKEKRVLVPGAERGWYLPNGLLLYATTEGTMFAVPFDAKKGEISGAPTVVLDDVRQGDTFGFRFAVSPSGSMLYLPGTQLSGWQVVEVDRNGREQVIIPDFGFFTAPRWSPSGDRIALSRWTERGETNIWIYDTQSRTLSQLTKQGSDDRPSWSPDGKRVAYFSGADGRSDLYWMPADGSGPAERVAKGPDVTGLSATSWTPDGGRILFDGPPEDGGGDDDEDIFAVGTGSDRTRQVVLASAADEQDGQVSPDGRWLAYTSDEDGSYKIYVRPFLSEGGRWLVSTDEATNPLWASNSELTYRDAPTRAMMSAKLDFTASAVRVLERTKLFDGSAYNFSGQGTAQHDLSRDGQRFLVLRQPQGNNNEIPAVMVLNWTEEVRQRTQQQGARTP